MGFSKGNEVFGQMADYLIRLVAINKISEDVAQGIAGALIETLQDVDWDTESESLENYSHVSFIIEAFDDCGITLDEDDDEDDDDEDDEDVTTPITVTKE